VSAAEDEIRKQRAGYQPTLDVTGSYGRNSQQVGNFPGQAGYDIRQGVIGLQLNVPLYSGGAQFARVDEAIALREKARQDLVSTQRAAQLGAKQAWFGWLAANTRRAAAVQAGRAALLALRAADSGLAAGVRTQLDRLQAQQQLEAARRDLNKAHYELVVSFVRLKAACGQLSDEDLQALERLFARVEPELETLAIAVPR
jgi:outer membrane protein